MTVKKEIPRVIQIDYDLDSIDALKAEFGSQDDAHIILDYPTVYIVYDENDTNTYSVYVGETNDIRRRSIEHLLEDPRTREDWNTLKNSEQSKLIIIGHDHFNKSLTLDLENQLMLYISGVGSVKQLNNRRDNPQRYYYTSKEKDQIFSAIWKRLSKKNQKLFPPEEIIKNSALFKASPFHDLTENQEDAKQKILQRVWESLIKGKPDQLILVEGEAGSGKTVLLSTVFYLITQFSKESIGSSREITAALLVNHDEQLKVYQDIARKLGIDATSISKPTRFINTHSSDDQVDVVLVDEAHLLWTQGKQSYRGQNQLEDIRRRAKVTIAVFDPHQILKTEEYVEKEQLESMETLARVQGNQIVLNNQLRMNASEATISWLRNLTEDRIVGKIPKDNAYDLQIFDNPADLYTAIKAKNDNSDDGLSRMLATFDWDYVSKGHPDDGDYWMVEVKSDNKIGELRLPWNLQLPIDKSQKGQRKNLAWAEQNQTINEIGSTYTIQGFDLNYAGLIIGPSVKFRNNRIVFDPALSKNKNAIRNRTLASGRKSKIYDELLPNELNVLLTRGVKGLYIYAVDDQLRNALLNAQK